MKGRQQESSLVFIWHGYHQRLRRREQETIFVKDSPTTQELFMLKMGKRMFYWKASDVYGVMTRWGFIYKPFQHSILDWKRGFDTFSLSHHAYIKRYRLKLRTFTHASMISLHLWRDKAQGQNVSPFSAFKFLYFFKYFTVSLHISWLTFQEESFYFSFVSASFALLIKS